MDEPSRFYYNKNSKEGIFGCNHSLISLYQRRKGENIKDNKAKRRMMTINEIPVQLGERSYPIYIGCGIHSEFGALFKRHNRSRQVAIVTDSHVEPLYAGPLKEVLAGAGIQSDILCVPAGESSKSLEKLGYLYDGMMGMRLERSDAVVALGGGVVGDLAGFAAATFKRGIQFVQMPTTLLAMVDSSVGGKTGINHPGGKNMIGAFYQPSMVIADVATLKTLPARELGCGLCESVKHGAIQDGEFFDYLDSHKERIAGLDMKVLSDLVARNCRIKARVVSEDERESGLRRILNYGHTIGHPFETVLPGHPYHHGEAVSLGIVAENRMATARGAMQAEDADRIEALLQAFGLPVRAGHDLPVEALYRGVLHDKKVQDSKVVFAIPDRIGHCEIYNDFTEDEIVKAIEYLMT